MCAACRCPGEPETHLHGAREREENQGPYQRWQASPGSQTVSSALLRLSFSCSLHVHAVFFFSLRNSVFPGES